MHKVLWLVISYFIGGIPFAYIVAKLSRGIDIREVGSRNVGATNVAREAGLLLGALTAFLDISKGFLPTFFALRQFGANWAIVTGAAAVFGHSFTPYLRMKGGKGVATIMGAFLALAPKATLVGLLVFIAVAFITRYVSLASLSGVTVGTFFIAFTSDNGLLIAVTIILAFLIFLRHRSNIRRLLRKEERRFSIRK